MLGSGLRPGQEVGGIILSSCRGGGPDSRPTHTRVSHFQNHSRLSYPVFKFNGPRTLPNRVRKLFPNWQSKQDQNLQVGSITPGILKHERGQCHNASPRPREACTAHFRLRPPSLLCPLDISPTLPNPHPHQSRPTGALCFSSMDTMQAKPTVRKASLPRFHEPGIKCVPAKCHCCGPVRGQMSP